MYRKEILKGLRYLKYVQNSDGGIPATSPGVISGCWTSGETLEALLASPYHDKDPRPFALSLINFLESSQLNSGQDARAWPLVVGGKRGSTMATGHVIAALGLAMNYFEGDPQLTARLQKMIEAGLEWLEMKKNVDGGWGVEPSGGVDGTVSRMISTVYALRAYSALSKTANNSRTVRDAITCIRTFRNRDGGFGGKLSLPSDPCNTARAVSALLRSEYCTASHPDIKDALMFIIRSRPGRKLWYLDTETYVTEGAPGQTIYNSNTTSDVLEAFIWAGCFSKHVKDLIKWFLDNQQDDGSWFLGANDSFVREIKTWATNEAIYPLGLASTAYAERWLPALEQERSKWKKLSLALAITAVTEAFFIVEFPVFVKSAWNNLPSPLRDLLVQVIIVGVVVNLVSALLYDRAREIVRRFHTKQNQQK